MYSFFLKKNRWNKPPVQIAWVWLWVLRTRVRAPASVLFCFCSFAFFFSFFFRFFLKCWCFLLIVRVCVHLFGSTRLAGTGLRYEYHRRLSYTRLSRCAVCNAWCFSLKKATQSAWSKWVLDLWTWVRASTSATQTLLLAFFFFFLLSYAFDIIVIWSICPMDSFASNVAYI